MIDRVADRDPNKPRSRSDARRARQGQPDASSPDGPGVRHLGSGEVARRHGRCRTEPTRHLLHELPAGTREGLVTGRYAAFDAGDESEVIGNVRAIRVFDA